MCIFGGQKDEAEMFRRKGCARRARRRGCKCTFVSTSQFTLLDFL